MAKEGAIGLVLRRTGPSVSERPASDSLRGPYRQSLPPLAKLRPSAHAGVGSGERGSDRSLKRREPKRKSLTFSGGARGLRDIFGKSRSDAEVGVHLSLTRVQCVGVGVGGTGYASLPRSPGRELGLLVGLQRDTLQALEHAVAYEEELLLLQQRLQKSEAEDEEEAGEEEFWASELRAEQESERRLRLRLAELQARVHDCSARLQEHLARVQTMEAGLEQERLQQEAALNQQANEEEVRAQLAAVRAELEAQGQHSSRLESSCRALERSLGHASQKLQEEVEDEEEYFREEEVEWCCRGGGEVLEEEVEDEEVWCYWSWGREVEKEYYSILWLMRSRWQESGGGIALRKQLRD
ncbi:hypothetical protein CRUP_013797 [Coryphaenoides rupestris]|nr:hypothetical protein CRUP_013797 [Coryphaenoides rupestris]